MEVSFTNPHLLDRAQWYPAVPEGTAADAVGSFAKELPYICIVGKAHFVFRLVYPYSVMESLYYEDGLQSYPDVKGIDILVRHTYDFALISEVVSNEVWIGISFFTNIKDIQNIIFSYYPKLN